MFTGFILSTLAAGMAVQPEPVSPLTAVVNCVRGEATQRARSSDAAEAVAEAAAAACQPVLDRLLPASLTIPGDPERARREQANLDTMRTQLATRIRALALATVRAERVRN